jgi:hypothetical protein
MFAPLTRLQLAAVVLAVVMVTTAFAWFAFAATEKPEGNGSPPRASGYFKTLPPGSWRDLPGDAACSRRVHRSTWEPRPDNWVPNHTMPVQRTVHESLASRPDASDPRWDSWLLARVTGHHVGTTDENIQWAACKWGISDNLLRAVAVRESTWYQYEIYPNGGCLLSYGCSTLSRPNAAAREYCAGIGQTGHNYQRDFGVGRCPRSFSIVGVMSWQDPAWGRLPGNQNGTFPFNRDSTAFALDYFASYLRGCQEGWVHWLTITGPTYGPGDIWGCVGSWYAGAWHSKQASEYIADVRHELQNRTWLKPAFAEFRPRCAVRFGGCPHGISKAYRGPNNTQIEFRNPENQ